MANPLRLLTLAVVAYALLVGALFLAQRRLIYFPDRSGPDLTRSGVPEMEEVRLETDDGLDLLAWYRPADDRRPTLVFFHGNAGHIGDRGWKVRPYLDAGLGVLLVSWRGYGGNPGRPTEEGLYADGRAALAFLDAAGVPSGRVVLYGESLGGGAAVQMAAERKVGALILEAPFTSLADAASRHYWYVPARWLLLDRFDSAAKIARVRAPILVLHGEQDRVVPVALGRALFAAAPEPKEILLFEQAGHNDLHDFAIAEAVLDFLARHLAD